MKLKNIFLISALTGIAIGLLSTYPITLGPLPSFILWGTAGVALGFFMDERRTIIYSGILYGVFLSIVFLFSRFGGSTDKITSYALFAAVLSIIGAISGIVTIFVGLRLKQKVKLNMPSQQTMRNILDMILILGFLAVDFFFFHDIFKSGEVITFPQYLTGFLSVLVFIICAHSLIQTIRERG